MTARRCYTRTYIEEFLKWQTSASIDGKGGEEALVKLTQLNGKYEFTHKNWGGVPVILNMNHLKPCQTQDSEFGAIMILYVMGQLNFLLEKVKDNTISKGLVEEVNKGIARKIQVVSDLTT